MEDTEKTFEVKAPRDERVGALAYLIWERDGRPEGKAEEHWLLACSIIDAQDQGIELDDLPPWLSRTEIMPTAEKLSQPKATVEKLMHHPRHKSAA